MKKNLLVFLGIIFVFLFFLTYFLGFSNKLAVDGVETEFVENRLDNCNLIENESAREYCIIESTVCENNNCIYLKAINLRDSSFCDELTEEKYVIECIDLVKENIIPERAVIDDDINVCNELSDLNLVQSCEDNFNFAKSVNQKDLSFCEIIINIDLKKVCLN